VCLVVRLIFLVLLLIVTVSNVTSAAYSKEEVRALIREKNFSEVEKYLDELLMSKEPGEIYSKYRSAIVTLEQQCELEKALEFVEKYVDCYPNYEGDAYFYKEKGRLLCDLNRYH